MIWPELFIICSARTDLSNCESQKLRLCSAIFVLMLRLVVGDVYFTSYYVNTRSYQITNLLDVGLKKHQRHCALSYCINSSPGMKCAYEFLLEEIWFVKTFGAMKKSFYHRSFLPWKMAESFLCVWPRVLCLFSPKTPCKNWQ